MMMMHYITLPHEGASNTTVSLLAWRESSKLMFLFYFNARKREKFKEMIACS